MSYQNRSGQNGREEGKEERGDHDNKKDNFAEAPTTGRNPKRGVRGAKEGKSREGADEGTERERERRTNRQMARTDRRRAQKGQEGARSPSEEGGRTRHVRGRKTFNGEREGGMGRRAAAATQTHLACLPACLPSWLVPFACLSRVVCN